MLCRGDRWKGGYTLRHTVALLVQFKLGLYSQVVWVLLGCFVGWWIESIQLCLFVYSENISVYFLFFSVWIFANRSNIYLVESIILFKLYWWFWWNILVFIELKLSLILFILLIILPFQIVEGFFCKFVLVLILLVIVIEGVLKVILLNKFTIRRAKYIQASFFFILDGLVVNNPLFFVQPTNFIP